MLSPFSTRSSTWDAFFRNSVKVNVFMCKISSALLYTAVHERAIPCLYPRQGITPAGVIAGFYVDSSSVAHGYLRAPDGGFTTFDVSGAGTGPGQGTFNENIGVTATTTGWYIDSGGALHAFLRTPKGAITKFDALGAGTGAGQGTSAGGITPAG